MRYIDMTGAQKAKVQAAQIEANRAWARKNAAKIQAKAQAHACEFVLLYAERECNGDKTGRLTRRMGVEKAECEALVQQLADAGVEFSPIYSVA